MVGYNYVVNMKLIFSCNVVHIALFALYLKSELIQNGILTIYLYYLSDKDEIIYTSEPYLY